MFVSTIRNPESGFQTPLNNQFINGCQKVGRFMTDLAQAVDKCLSKSGNLLKDLNSRWYILSIQQKFYPQNFFVSLSGGIFLLIHKKLSRNLYIIHMYANDVKARFLDANYVISCSPRANNQLYETRILFIYFLRNFTRYKF